jgi:hypothetical protein
MISLRCVSLHMSKLQGVARCKKIPKQAEIGIFRVLQDGIFIEHLNCHTPIKPTTPFSPFWWSTIGQLTLLEDTIRYEYPGVTQIMADVWDGEQMTYRLCGFEPSDHASHIMVKQIKNNGCVPTLNQYIMEYNKFQTIPINSTMYDKTIQKYIQIK